MHKQQGLGRLTVIVFTPIIAVGLFVAYHVLPFYYYYFSIEEQMKQLVRVAGIYPDKILRAKLWDHIKRFEIPVRMEDVKIERNLGSVSMSFEYDEVFYVKFRGEEHEIYTFHFSPYAEANLDARR